jgi:hypothetical protein
LLERFFDAEDLALERTIVSEWRTETTNGNAHSPQRLAEKKPLQPSSSAVMLLAADEDGG